MVLCTQFSFMQKLGNFNRQIIESVNVIALVKRRVCIFKSKDPPENGVLLPMWRGIENGSTRYPLTLILE